MSHPETTASLDVQIAEREQKIFELDQILTERMRARTAVERKVLELQENLGTLEGKIRQRLDDAAAHYQQTHDRVRGEYEAKVADFEANIKGLQAQRLEHVNAAREARDERRAAEAERDSVRADVERAQATLYALEKRIGLYVPAAPAGVPSSSATETGPVGSG